MKIKPTAQREFKNRKFFVLFTHVGNPQKECIIIVGVNYIKIWQRYNFKGDMYGRIKRIQNNSCDSQTEN